MTVKHTTNLEQFKFHSSNRKVNRSHVRKLADSISKVGLKTPITVSAGNVILDGQHRYEAIKLLIEKGESVKLPYIKKNMKISDIAEMNSNQLKWTNMDWIRYHVTNGNSHYQDLVDCQGIYNTLKMSALAPFLHTTEDAYLSTPRLNGGEFVFDLTPDKEYILDQLNELAKFRPEFSQKAVLSAIMWLSRSPNFDARRLFKKLSANLSDVRQQSGRSNWAGHLLYWYNKGLRNGRLDPHDLPSSH